jgi:hypothetical protein
LREPKFAETAEPLNLSVLWFAYALAYALADAFAYAFAYAFADAEWAAVSGSKTKS